MQLRSVQGAMLRSAASLSASSASVVLGSDSSRAGASSASVMLGSDSSRAGASSASVMLGSGSSRAGARSAERGRQGWTALPHVLPALGLPERLGSIGSTFYLRQTGRAACLRDRALLRTPG